MTAAEGRQTLLVAFLGQFRRVRSLPLELPLDGPRPLPAVTDELCELLGPSFADLTARPDACLIHNNLPVDRALWPATLLRPGDELVFVLGLGAYDKR